MLNHGSVTETHSVRHRKRRLPHKSYKFLITSSKDSDWKPDSRCLCLVSRAVVPRRDDWTAARQSMAAPLLLL